MSLPITIRLDLRAIAKLVVFAANLGFIREFEFACPHYAKKAKNRACWRERPQPIGGPCSRLESFRARTRPRRPACVRHSLRRSRRAWRHAQSPVAALALR